MKNIKTSILKASLIALGLQPIVSNAQWVSAGNIPNTLSLNTNGVVGIGLGLYPAAAQGAAALYIKINPPTSGTVIRASLKSGGAGNEARIDLSTIDLDANPQINARIAVRDMDNYNGALVFYTDGDGIQNSMVTERMMINYNGNVGIGTSTPSTKLDVAGTVKATGYYSSGNVGIGTTSARAILDVNGQVVIGTRKTTATDYQLSVDGKIYCTELNITLGLPATGNSNWADYVFKSNYKLASLTEVEKYIKENGHLEHVPTAEQVAKTGYKVGEMDATLLRKVEELTLYLLEQNRSLLEQNKKLQQQDQKIKELESEIKL